MADAGENLEAVRCRDEITRTLGGQPPDGVVGIAPDVEGGHPDRAERCADRAARAIPGQRRFHRVLVAEHGKMRLDRTCGNAGRGQPLAEPFRIIGQQQIGRTRFEKGLVMPRSVRLIAIGHLQRPAAPNLGECHKRHCALRMKARISR